jgi:hypothetical protein
MRDGFVLESIHTAYSGWLRRHCFWENHGGDKFKTPPKDQWKMIKPTLHFQLHYLLDRGQ